MRSWANAKKTDGHHSNARLPTPVAWRQGNQCDQWQNIGPPGSDWATCQRCASVRTRFLINFFAGSWQNLFQAIVQLQRGAWVSRVVAQVFAVLRCPDGVLFHVVDWFGVSLCVPGMGFCETGKRVSLIHRKLLSEPAELMGEISMQESVVRRVRWENQFPWPRCWADFAGGLWVHYVVRYVLRHDRGAFFACSTFRCPPWALCSSVSGRPTRPTRRKFGARGDKLFRRSVFASRCFFGVLGWEMADEVLERGQIDGWGCGGFRCR